MSAIWGTLNLHGMIPSLCDEKMRTHYETHCKIDRFETYHTPSLYMGCGIQYFTPQAPAEQLPFYDEAHGIIFTADCVLDNRSELLSLLEEKDTSIPDGMLLYKAYLKWGMDCLLYLRGLFSFAVYNSHHNTLQLATDQLSARCLYYYRNGDQISFSTLLEPLLRLHPEITVNEEYLQDFLCAPGLMPNVLPCNTPYQNVYKVNSGSYITFTLEDTQEHTYWTPASPIHMEGLKTAQDYGNFFRSLFEDCVKDALRTNGEVGISLSSGLDSASVGTIAADELAQRGKSLFTYTYVPYEAPNETHIPGHVYDETDEVKKIASMHPNMVTHFMNTQGKNCVEAIPECLDVMEIPFKAYVNLPSLFEIYEAAAKRGCKIVLTGQMGNSSISMGYIDDVLYDLYNHHKYMTFLRYLNTYCIKNKESRKKALGGCLKLFKKAKQAYKAPTLNYTPDNPFLSDDLKRSTDIANKLYQTGFSTIERVPKHQAFYHKAQCNTAPLTYLGELDTKAGLKYGILLRDPTKDMRIMNFCYHLPFHLYAYQGTPRWLIRGNMTDMLPEQLLSQWMRYSVQNGDWHNRVSRDWLRILPLLKDNLTMPELSPYVNAQIINNYFTYTEEELSPQVASLTQPLLMVNVLAEFLKHRKF